MASNNDTITNKLAFSDDVTFSLPEPAKLRKSEAELKPILKPFGYGKPVTNLINFQRFRMRKFNNQLFFVESSGERLYTSASYRIC
jgi:hypothetical protein